MVATDLQSDPQTDSDMAATQAALDRIAPVLDRIGDCFYALDAGWRIVHFNAAAEYWFELKRASVIGRSFFDVFSPVRSSVVAEYCRAVFETGREIEREMDSIVNPRRRAMLRIFPLGPGIGIVISDRTGERDLRMALERSEVRLRRLADSNLVGIAVTDADGHILEANDAYLAMTGYSRRELDDGLANWATVTPPEYADVEAAHLAQADADGVCDAYEKEYIRRDGSRVPVFIRFARLQQAERRYICIVQDMTQQKAALKALAESEQRFRTMANVVPAIVWSKDQAWPSGYFNDRWLEYSGLTPDEASSRSWVEGVHPDDVAVIKAAWRKAQKDNTGYEVEARYRRADGAWRWFLVRAAPIRDDSGAIIGWSGASTDIHDRKVMEDELRRLNEELEKRVEQAVAEREQAFAALAEAQKMEAIGQLTGGVAHDFNNLLQALSSCLQMVDRRSNDARLRPLLEAGFQAISRGAKLTRQLMAFARREAVRTEVIDVPSQILSMSGLLARVLRADIAIATEFGPDLWAVEVDPTQFELALINLAANARDAMPDGGRFVIAADNVEVTVGDRSDIPEGSYLRLRVTDSGTGMPPEILARVFEPFFTTKPSGLGSGLGLSQVYGFARQSGGVVHIDSEPGRTTVTLLLPRSTRRPRSAKLARRDGQMSMAVSQKQHILVVEDDPLTIALVAPALENIGYVVACAGNADEALRVLSDSRKPGGQPIDLLFSDVVLPGGSNGVKLAEEARRIQPHLPVVLTTGYGEGIAEAHGLRILPKPYRIEELVTALEAELGRRTS